MAKQKETVNPMLEQWKTQYGEVYTIKAEGEGGEIYEGFYRKPAYDVKKKALMIVMKADTIKKNGYNEETGEPVVLYTPDPEALINAGELYLSMCWIGGDNLYTDEYVRAAASMQILELIDVGGTASLKKS